jgi:hypothetical protein
MDSSTMNIKDLERITPILVAEAEAIPPASDFYRTALWTEFAHNNRDIIIAGLRAGLRVKRELEGMKKE